jgi:hypothetical protein
VSQAFLICFSAQSEKQVIVAIANSMNPQKSSRQLASSLFEAEGGNLASDRDRRVRENIKFQGPRSIEGRWLGVDALNF